MSSKRQRGEASSSRRRGKEIMEEEEEEIPEYDGGDIGDDETIEQWERRTALLPRNVELNEGGRTIKFNTDEGLFYAELRRKPIGKNEFIEDEVARAFGVFENLRALMNQGKWPIIFSMREKVYEPVFYEVLATMWAKPFKPKIWTQDSMSFRAFGKTHKLNINKLGNKLGFYKTREINSPDYADLPYEFPSLAIRDAFWTQVTRPGLEFKPGISHANELNRPEYRILHRIIAHSLVGRRLNDSKVYATDLLCLWSMVTNTPIHMGMMVHMMIYKQIGEKTRHLYCGPFITKLLDGLKLGERVRREEPMDCWQPITAATLRTLKIYPPPHLQQQEGEDPQDGAQPEAPMAHMHYGVPPEFGVANSWATLQNSSWMMHQQVMAQFERQATIQDQLVRDVAAARGEIRELKDAWSHQYPDYQWGSGFGDQPPPQPDA